MLTNEEIKKIREGLATKEDLKIFASKNDLESFAAKDDLKRFATKDDLKNFATKVDLKYFATKKDLKKLENRIIKKLNEIIHVFDREILEARERLDRLEQKLNLPPLSPIA